ncbi:U6 snRNA-associated Sm-like protein LSm5 [Metarhizium anisopliae]
MASQLLPLGEASWPSQNLILPADSRVELIDNLKSANFNTGEEANSELEFSGTLVGFDDYVNMVLEDVTEFDYSGTHTKLPKILLNGNNICMLIPGGEGPA